MEKITSSGEEFVKRAGDGAGIERLRREAAVLEAARHPGVVELTRFDDHGATVALGTARIEGGDLVSRPPLSLAEAAGVLAGVASTLTDLHEIGIVHGAVAPEHVLVGPGGRPLLCGLGHGGRAGQVPVASPGVPDGFSDPARSAADPLLPETDVFALGALITWMLQTCPGTRPSRALLKLRAIAARATTADAERRPSAREVAAAITAAMPDSRLPAGARREPSEDHPGGNAVSRLRRRSAEWCRGRLDPGRARVSCGGVVAGGAVAGVVALLAAAYWLEAAGRTDSPGTGAASPPPAPGGGHSPAQATGPSVDARCAPVTGLLAADVDGDGCAEPLRWRDGVLEGGSVRWAVGQPGDQVATGDWQCTGAATLALLRPTTGEVFVFDRWAAPGRDLVAGVAARIDGGFALRQGDLDGDACPDLVVERRSGPPATVPQP